MTDEQMRKRIKEIDTIRRNLADEKQEYLDILSEKERQLRCNKHEQFVGKYFAITNLPDNKHLYIKAFKILSILDSPNEDYAKCLVLIDGCRSSIWVEKGICNMTLGLWNNNVARLIPQTTDLKVIDYYHEITEEKFEELWYQYFEWVDYNNV